MPTSPAPDTALDDMLCLALHQASRAMTARYRPLLRELGLTYPQYLVMVLLWQEGACSVGQVGARLGLESSTLSPLLKRLEATGLLSRTRSTHDERSVLVRLTPRGEALRGDAAGIPDRVCDAAGLDGAQQADLVGRLRAVADRLDTPTSVESRTT